MPPVRVSRPLLALVALALLAGCGERGGADAAARDATPATVSANAQSVQDLKLDDPQDFDDASRGFIARPEGKLLGADGSLLIDFDA